MVPAVISGRQFSVAALLALAAVEAPAAVSPRALFARGVLQAQRGQADVARADLEAAFAADPNALPLLRRVAAARLAAGELAAASTAWREFVQRNPDRVEARLLHARFLLESSPGDALARRLAIETLEQARVLAPADPAVLAPLFREYENAGRRHDSEALFQAALPVAKNHPALALALTDLARVLYPADSADGRRIRDELHQQALDDAPADPAIALAAAEYFRTSGRLDQALAALQQHVAAAPESLDLRIRLGILLLAAKRDDQGRAALEEVLALDPRRALAHQTLAKFHRRAGNPEAARHHSAEALKLRGGDPAEFTALADEFLAAKQPREARLLLEKAVFHHPDDPALAARLAIATRRDPSTVQDAARLFREAEALAVGQPAALSPSFLAESAEALVDAGQAAVAEQRLRDAIRAFPPEAKSEAAAAMRRLAALWQKAGRNQAAAKALLERAERLAPPP